MSVVPPGSEPPVPPASAPPDPSRASLLQPSVQAGGLRWRVRCEGDGPDLLLLHGTASSLESWSRCSSQLRDRFRVWTPDLPGHGQTSAWADGHSSLPRMAQALAALMHALDCRPVVVAGHSAGAALMLQLTLDGAVAPRGLLSVNGAILPLAGLPGLVFPPMARWMARSPWLPRFVARRAASPRALSRLIASTGSQLDDQGIAHYQRLLSSDSHVSGALAMMASWRLEALQANLHRLRTPLWLAAGSADGTVSPAQAAALARQLPSASLHPLPGLGHLAHEESPAAVVALVDALWASVKAPG